MQEETEDEEELGEEAKGRVWWGSERPAVGTQKGGDWHREDGGDVASLDALCGWTGDNEKPDVNEWQAFWDVNDAGQALRLQFNLWVTSSGPSTGRRESV